MKYANEENLEAVVVAQVTEEPGLVLKWRDKEIVIFPRFRWILTERIRRQKVQVDIPE